MNLGNVSNYTPINFAESPDGQLFMATGIGAMFKWDGQAALHDTVGVTAPPDAPTIAFSGSGTINGTYNAYLRFVDSRGNFSSVSPVSANATATNAQTVTYSGLDLPVESKVVRRQLLRNTNGQFTTYYVDVDTTDLTSTTLTSTNTDAALTALTAVPSTNLSIYGLPPSHKWAIANHLGRMFAAVEVNMSLGHAKVTNGSTSVLTVSGFGSIPVGRYLYVNGGLKAYKIIANPSNNVITLDQPYAGPTDPFATYGIRPAPTERRLVYFSLANLPDSWPASNAIAVQEDGDELTGLMPFGSFLYILENRHVYRFTYQTDPLTDGFIFQALNRGCINQRSWLTVDGTAYLLDEQGIYAFNGGAQSDPISTAIQDIFRFSDSPLRVNWSASRWFHVVHFSSQEVIRWFVALSGQYLPYHAICYNYRQKRWWIEEWATNIGASVAGTLASAPQVYLGTSASRFLAMWQGTLDGPDPLKGTVRGTVTGNVDVDSFADVNATFASTGIVNNPISIVDGRGKGQRQIVQHVTGGNSITVKYPWLILPDTTSVYQLGGVQWQFQTGWFKFTLSEELTERAVELVFQTCTNPALATLQLFTDFGSTPVVWRGDFTLNDSDGARTVINSPDIVLDFTKTSGYVKKRIPGHREFWTDGPRYVSFSFSGVSNQEQQRLYYIALKGMEQ